MSAVAAMDDDSHQGLAGVRARLERWADWLRRSWGGGGTHSILGRFLERGCIPPHGYGWGVGAVSERNPEAEATDAEIAKMPRWLREAVFARYLSPGPDEVRARRCNCSITTYKARLQSAHCWLLGRLQAP